MSANPVRRGSKPPIDVETEAILAERLKTIDRDEKDSVDAQQALADIRKNLKRPQPR